MKIQAPPGMRDFYPEEMRLQNWLFDGWRRVSKLFGFEEYEGPIFEYRDLYALKSGEDLAANMFSFTDRGERQFAIRPEMTPTLARMVAARANALPRPIKWFSIPRMCRAEKPQRGRLREFFQWNVDVLGVEDVLADAEVIAVACEFFREVGLGTTEVVVRISSRPAATAALIALGVPSGEIEKAFALIDRAEKLAPDEFEKLWNLSFGENCKSDALQSRFMSAPPADVLRLAADSGAGGAAARASIDDLMDRLKDFGVADYCELDLRIVRGLAYYTGAVFEVHPRTGTIKALAGGGRYDNLTALLDGPTVPGVGFGMGDSRIIELLSDLKRLPDLGESIDAFVVDASETLFGEVLRIVGELRRQGLCVDFSYRRQPIGKQLKQASSRGALHILIAGSELTERGEIVAKNLETGRQLNLPLAGLLESPRSALAGV